MYPVLIFVTNNSFIAESLVHLIVAKDLCSLTLINLCFVQNRWGYRKAMKGAQRVPSIYDGLTPDEMADAFLAKYPNGEGASEADKAEVRRAIHDVSLSCMSPRISCACFQNDSPPTLCKIFQMYVYVSCFGLFLFSSSIA